MPVETSEVRVLDSAYSIPYRGHEEPYDQPVSAAETYVFKSLSKVPSRGQFLKTADSPKRGPTATK